MSILRPGQSFAGYRLVALISRGGMGEVWRAQKSGPDGWAKQVALKVILPNMADQERFVAMFMAEARIAAQLDHPNIVPVFAFGREDDVLWFEQEYVDGEDLSRLLTRVGRLPAALVPFVIAEVLKALRYAWEARGLEGRALAVVHRDVKPHNVLIAREGHVKLSDFGVAKVTAETSTSQSEIKGTAGYIAPEVIDGGPPTHQADLFGAGLIFWEMLVGKKLFDGATEATRIRKTWECVVPPLRDVGVTAAPEVEAVLRGLLARDPAARTASAAVAVDAILAAPGGRGATSVELKNYLATVLPAPSQPTPAVAAPVSKTGAGTGSMVGEVSGGVSPRRRGRWIAVALTPVAAGAVYLAVAWKPAAQEKPQPAASTIQHASLLPTPSPSPAPSPAVIAAAPSRYAQVRIEVIPETAEVRVGEKLQPGGSPYELLEVDSSRPMVVRVAAPGYEPLEREYTVTGPRMTIPIELVPATSGSRRKPEPAAVQKEPVPDKQPERKPDPPVVVKQPDKTPEKVPEKTPDKKPGKKIRDVDGVIGPRSNP